VNSGESAEHVRGDNSGLRASQRIALGTLARSFGEVVAKLASLVLYVAIARELGQVAFGDFVFAISLSGVLLMVAGLGLQEMVVRDIARADWRLDELFWNVNAIKTLMLVVVLGIIAIIAWAQGHSVYTVGAIVVIAFGVGLDYQANTIFAVFQGFERQHHTAASVIVNRVASTTLGLGVLAAGAGLMGVAIAVTVGSAAGLVTAHVLMHRYVAQPSYAIERRAWRDLVRMALPLGAVATLYQALLQIGVVMVGLIAGSAVVGEYGAAFRLIEATLFVAWGFGGALLPWFARHTGKGGVEIARGYELGLKVMIGLLLPISLVFALFAGPLIEALYGPGFDGAVTPLQLLSVMAVMCGVNSIAMTVMIGRDRPKDAYRPALLALVLSGGLSFLVIPPLDADGAALVAVAAQALLIALTVPRIIRLLGPISPVRALVPPGIAGGLMALAAVALAALPWVAAAAVAGLLYGATFLLVERVFFPGDFALYSGVLRNRRAAPAST
jgi:O-antigen/teichoic acid export membrane protein